MGVKSTIVILIAILVSIQGRCQGFLKADGARIVNGKGKEIILRGMGLGGWMLQEPYMLGLSGVAARQEEIRAKIDSLIGKEKTDKFYEAWLNNFITEEDIKFMKAAGFNSVRLPMHYNLYTLPVEQEPIAGKHTWIQKGFDLTDQLLKWCKKYGLYLILDLHAAPGGQGKDEPIADYNPAKPSLWEKKENRDKTIALWVKLAERYKDEEWIGAYDLINEPNWGFSDPKDKNGCNEKSNALLREHYVELTNAIRAIDQKHIIIIEGNCWGNNYQGIFPLWDKNLVISFHKYWNFNDEASLQGYREIREKYNVPLWLGESGENSNVWFTNAISLVERNGIGWAWWPLKKLGFNNPLQIRTNQNFEKLTAFWKHQGPRPTEEETYEGLMKLAEASLYKNNIVRTDVVDAMFRQVVSDETWPFKIMVTHQEMTLHAVNYDRGKIGMAYMDKDTGNYWVSNGKRTAGNKGGKYRNDGVDISECQAPGSNGYCVSSFEEGEWMQYTVKATTEASYKLQLMYASAKPSRIMIEVNGKGTEITLPANGDGFSLIDVPPIRFKKGNNKIRIHSDSGEPSLAYLKLRAENKDHASK